MTHHPPDAPAATPAGAGDAVLRRYLQHVGAVQAPPAAVLHHVARQLAEASAADPWPAGGAVLGSTDGVSPDAPGGSSSVAGLSALVAPPPELLGPWLLGQVHEALLDGDRRTARGAWFTPPPLARRLVAAAGMTAPRRVLDPACGGGSFLLAAAEAHGPLHLAGRDIDPLAVAVTRAALRLVGAVDVDVVQADGLAPASRRYDLVLGNPPFLSQLRTATTRDAARRQELRRRFGSLAAGYVDEAGLFLLATATELLAADGVAVLVVPDALLATASAAALRREVASRCTVEVVWRDDGGTFPQTPTCAVRLAPRRVGRTSRTPSASEDVATHDAAVGDAVADDAATDAGNAAPAMAAPAADPGAWSHLLATGIPAVTLPDGLPTIGTVASATADFRDAYYLLAEHVGEQPDAGPTGQRPTATGGIADRTAADRDHTAPVEGHRIVPVGLIDPAHLRWGEVDVRFAKQTWRRPVAIGLPQDFLDRRLGPKLLLATQSAVIEALVDAVGDLLPSTPVITVRSERLWHVGAALTSPVLTALAARRHAGAARSRGAIKLSATQVLALPLPGGPSAAWDRAADAYRDAHDSTDPRRRRELLERCGRDMAIAYGRDGGAGNPLDDLAAPDLIAWWRDRLPVRPPGPTPAQIG